jgi:hypothetical protein
MNKKDKKYWFETLDRFGLLVGGIFLGGVMDLVGINRLAIIVSVVLMFVIAAFWFIVEHSKEKLGDSK